MQVVLFDDDERIREICTLYWELDGNDCFTWKVSELAKKFGISSYEVTQTSERFCEAQSEKISCVICGIQYVFKSRADFKSRHQIDSWICDACEITESESIENKKRELLTEAYIEAKKNAYSIVGLDATMSIFLLALVRHSATENLAYLNSYTDNNIELLAPNINYSIEVIRKLYRQNLIAIHPDSQLDAIELKDEGGFSFSLDKVKWVLPANHFESHPQQLISALENKIESMDLIDNYYDQVVDLSKEISLQECLSYVDYVMSEHNFDFKPGEKTRIVLSKALDNFAVSQIYNFIWRAGKDAAAYYQRSSVPKKQAANSLVGNIERQVEKAISNDWQVTKFRRNYDLPQSILSRVLFNSLLKTDDGGFTTQLNKVL